MHSLWKEGDGLILPPVSCLPLLLSSQVTVSSALKGVSTCCPPDKARPASCSVRTRLVLGSKEERNRQILSLVEDGDGGKYLDRLQGQRGETGGDGDRDGEREREREMDG